MTDFNRTVPAYKEPSHMAVAARATMTTTGPISNLDTVAGILAVVMTQGPLAMVAFTVGRY